MALQKTARKSFYAQGVGASGPQLSSFNLKHQIFGWIRNAPGPIRVNKKKLKLSNCAQAINISLFVS